MAANHRRPISPSLTELPKRTALLHLLLLLLASTQSTAQPQAARPAAASQGLYKSSVSPTMTILLVAIIGAFFLLTFFTVYFSCCTGGRSAVTPAENVGIGVSRSRHGTTRGLDLALLRRFPTMVYSDVKGHKLGKETLECAVCLCEFENEDILRLLPRCSHVFHLDCIDVWLDTHATCPVCRCDLGASAGDPLTETEVAVIDVVGEDTGKGDREGDLADLVRIGSQRRARSGSVRGIQLSSRSREDWASIVAGGDGRYTLRLPEDIRREFLEAGQLKRSASLGVYLGRSDGCSWRGHRDGRDQGWRSLRLGQSARWPIIWRSVSARGREASADRSVSGSSKCSAIDPNKESLARLDCGGEGGGGGGGGGGAGGVKPYDSDSSMAYSQGNSAGRQVSEEERNLWIELENEIEKSLEEEIKEGIRRQAIRLHKLYQQRTGVGIGKMMTSSSKAPEISRAKSKTSSSKTCTEVIISIENGAGCSIQTRELKINGIRKDRPLSSRSETGDGRPIYTGKRFDWSQTLRNAEYEWKL